MFKTDLSDSFKFSFRFIKWVKVTLDFVHVGVLNAVLIYCFYLYLNLCLARELT